MTYQLKTKLKGFLIEKRLSVAEAERQAGLKTSAIRNILNGQSKNPTAQTLQKLAHVFQCSIYDLLDNIEENPVLTHPSFKSSDDIDNLELFASAINLVLESLKSTNQSICLEDFFYLVDQIHQYSLGNQLRFADPNFAKWIINEKLKSLGKETN